jgi:colicin import membrane protein
MKPGLEAWAASSNPFHQSFAKETDDPDVAPRPFRRSGGAQGSHGIEHLISRAPGHLPDLGETASVRKESRPRPKSIVRETGARVL